MIRFLRFGALFFLQRNGGKECGKSKLHHLEIRYYIGVVQLLSIAKNNLSSRAEWLVGRFSSVKKEAEIPSANYERNANFVVKNRVYLKTTCNYLTNYNNQSTLLNYFICCQLMS